MRDALNAIGVAGLTVTQVQGYGRQRGQGAVYRGPEYEVKFIPKLKVEVLVSSGEGRKDGATGRVSGRARDGRLVHVATGAAVAAPGDVVTSTVTHAAPHHLVADAGITAHRRWRGTADSGAQPAGGRQILTLTPRVAT